MRKLLLPILLFIGLVSMETNAQKLDLKWSDPIPVFNKTEGLFYGFGGSNSKLIYGVYSDYSNATITYKKPKTSMGKLKIVAFDKQMMKKVSEVKIVGFKETQATNQNYKGLRYHKMITFEDVIFVCYLKETKDMEEIWVETYDSKLQNFGKLKLIYAVKNADSRKARNNQSTFTLGNDEAGDKIVVGGELPVQKGESIKMEYKILNKDLTFSNAKSITLPFLKTDKDEGLRSTYEYGKDGNLYIKSIIKLSKEERKNLKKGELNNYGMLTIIDANSGNITPYPVKFENKNISSFNYIVTKDDIKLYGFYNDMKIDLKGKGDIHGIFYSIVDNKTFKVINTTFSDFDRKQLATLFKDDMEDKNKARGSKAESAEESIGANYNIEYTYTNSDDHIIIFASRMNNYTRQECTYNASTKTTTCVTKYYCEKRNVTCFNLDKTGKLVWASNLDRVFTYSGWNIHDVEAIEKDDKYYIVYNNILSSEIGNQGNNKRKKKKGRKELRNTLEYAVLDYKTGQFDKKEVIINNPEDKNKKYFDATDVVVLDEKFYTYYNQFKDLGFRACCAVASCGIAIGIHNVPKGNMYLGVLSQSSK